MRMLHQSMRSSSCGCRIIAHQGKCSTSRISASGGRLLGSENLTHRVSLALVIVAGLMPMTWYRPSNVIKGIDSFFSLHPETLMSQVLHTWSTTGSPGIPNNQIPGLPIWLAQFGLHFIGMPVPAAQIVVICTLSVTAALGAYVLTIEILRSSNKNLGPFPIEIGALAGGILWVANPAALAQVWYRQTLLEVTWALLPWLVRLFIQAASDSKDSLLRFFFRGLGITVVGSAGLVEAYLPGIAVLVSAWVSPLVYVSFKHHRVARLRPLVAVSGGVFAGVAWWLVPAIPFFKSIVRGTALSPSSSLELRAFSPYLSIQKILTLTNAPLIWQAPGPSQASFTSWSWIITRPSSFIIYLIPAVSITGVMLCFRRWRESTPAILGSVFAIIVGVIVTKGDNRPFRHIGMLLIQLPFGSVFRDPASTLIFVAALPICVLFGIGVCSLASLGVNWTMLGIVSMILIDGLACFAWWTSDVIPRSVGVIPSEYVTVPDSYQSFAGWANALRLGEKIMVLPYSKFNVSAFKWKSGADTGLDCVLPEFIVREIILCGNTNLGLADIPGVTLATDLARKKSEVFDLAKLWGVGTWLIHRDWDYEVAPDTYLGPNAISNLSKFAQSKASGNVELGGRIFKSRQLVALSQRALPLVYSPSILIKSSSIASSNNALNIAKHLVAGNRQGVEVQKSSGSPKCDKSAQLTINRGLNDLSGEIDGSGSVCLVFGETFDHGWQLILADSRSTVTSHFRANWWQNGWAITLDGKTQWHLIYHPQYVVELGLDVGLLEWAVCAIMVASVLFMKFTRQFHIEPN